MAKVLFVCEAYPELDLTMTAQDWKEVEGRAIKVHPHRVRFLRRAFRGKWRGEFSTSKESEISLIREHSYFQQGIVKEDADPDQVDRVGPELVKGGAIAVEPRGPVVPSDSSPEGAPAKVALKRAGRPKKSE